MKQLLILTMILACFAILSAQDFDINTFADTLKYNWKTSNDRYEFRTDLEFRNSLTSKYEKEMISVPFNMSKSIMMPGLGHFQTKNYFRGQILLSTEIVLAGASYFLYDKAMVKYRKYKSATQIDDMNQYYTDASGYYRQSTIFTTLFVMIWVYNVYDTYIVTNEYNVNLWNSLVEKQKENKITITPTGVSIKF